MVSKELNFRRFHPFCCLQFLRLSLSLSCAHMTTFVYENLVCELLSCIKLVQRDIWPTTLAPKELLWLCLPGPSRSIKLSTAQPRLSRRPSQLDSAVLIPGHPCMQNERYRPYHVLELPVFAWEIRSTASGVESFYSWTMLIKYSQSRCRPSSVSTVCL